MNARGHLPPPGGTASARPPGPALPARVLSVRDEVIPLYPFTGLLAIAAERGWAAPRLFSAFEFDAQGQPLPQQRCSYQQAREIILQACRLAGENLLSVDSGARKSLPHLGVLGPAMMAQATVGDALQFGLEYQGIAGSMLELGLEVADDEVRLLPRPLFNDAELQSFLEIDHLLTTANVLAFVPSVRPPLLRLELEGAVPAEVLAALAARLGCPVTAHAERTQLVLPQSCLASPLPHADRAAAVLWRHSCERELTALGRSGAGGLMACLLDGEGRVPAQNEIAQRLGISERTLHRLLAREGVQYAVLAEQSRMKAARRALLAGETTEDIAERLGYSDARSFRRAFLRATGQTPSAFRAGH